MGWAVDLARADEEVVPPRRAFRSVAQPCERVGQALFRAGVAGFGEDRVAAGSAAKRRSPAWANSVALATVASMPPMAKM